MNRPQKIVPIPTTMEKFYGQGKMLHPNIEDIKAMIYQVPKGKVTTIEIIATQLADRYAVTVTCPMRTGNTVKKIAKSAMGITGIRDIPFWRVVRKDLGLIKTGHEVFCIARLAEEGIEVMSRVNTPAKIIVTQEQLHNTYTF